MHNTNTDRNFVYGIRGIAELFNCSEATAGRIKKSGVINAATSQIGKKIVIDADRALELCKPKKNKKK